MDSVFKEIFEKSPVGMVIYGADGQCIEANDMASQIIGATIQEVLAQNMYQIDSWKKSGLIDVAKQTLTSGLEQAKEVTLTTTFGACITINVHFVPIQRDPTPFLLCLFYVEVSGAKCM